MKRIWSLKFFVYNPFFPSIFLFVHAHFVLVFFWLLSYLQRSKKYCKLRLDAAIAMKTIKKGQEMRDILICGQYNMHGIKCFLKTWMWIPISKISQNVMLGIKMFFLKVGASSFLGGLCKHIYMVPSKYTRKFPWVLEVGNKPSEIQFNDEIKFINY
jgi:hypothetical protein